MPAPFVIDPELMHVFYMPIPRPDLRVVVVFVFFAEAFWSKVGHIFQKN